MVTKRKVVKAKRGKWATGKKKTVKKNVVGYYNDREYSVDVNGRQVYRAGNSLYDSQVYTHPKKGVGLRKMRSFCIQTSKEIAKEHGAKYRGIERNDYDD
jgi:ribosomal protein L20